MIFDKSQYDFVDVLESNWKGIREEYYQSTLEHVQWFEADLNEDKKWQVLPIYDCPMGLAVKGYAENLPFTKGIIDKHIPYHRAASFSRLQAGAVVPEHNGIRGDWYRLHLGIDIPEGDCGITVGDETYKWKNGECVVFADYERHSAWNKSDQDRIVLIIDFIPICYD
jgi:aspartyl/asparaginyl beta-hydroxylase (cupin superfamily)